MPTFALPLLGLLAAPASDGLPPAPEPAAAPLPPVHGTPDPFSSPAEAPAAPPSASEEPDDGSFEIGGFMKRPPPPPPRVPDADPAETHLVWGFHRPVAPWKRKGLIASAAILGTAIVAGSVATFQWRRREDEVMRRANELFDDGWQPNARSSIDICDANMGPQVGGTVVVVDVGLAQSCLRMRRGVAAYRASVAVGVLAGLSTVTFAVLHAVRREPVRRVEARSDGFAVRF